MYAKPTKNGAEKQPHTRLRSNAVKRVKDAAPAEESAKTSEEKQLEVLTTSAVGSAKRKGKTRHRR